jgi:hypothetical protein
MTKEISLWLLNLGRALSNHQMRLKEKAPVRLLTLNLSYNTLTATEPKTVETT